MGQEGGKKVAGSEVATGGTYCIGGLVVRLLFEKPPSQRFRPVETIPRLNNERLAALTLERKADVHKDLSVAARTNAH